MSIMRRSRSRSPYEITNWVRLDVGGKPFHTTMSTLLSCPGSLLANMFDPQSNRPPAAQSENGVYYLDSDPKYFGIVLNWLRYRRLMADSNTNLNNVAEVAQYFGIMELVEMIRPTGKWVDFNKDLSEHGHKDFKRSLRCDPSDPPQHENVSPMKMYLSQNSYATLEYRCWRPSYFDLFQIVKVPNGLKLVREGEIAGCEGKCLELDLKGRAPVWVPTVMGQVPAGAIDVQGRKIEEMMHIGRKFWTKDRSHNVTQETVKMWCKGNTITVPCGIAKDENEMSEVETIISVGYVNEKGIFGITSSSDVNYILHDCTSFYEGTVENYSMAEFEVLCAF